MTDEELIQAVGRKRAAVQRIIVWGGMATLAALAFVFLQAWRSLHTNMTMQGAWILLPIAIVGALIQLPVLFIWRCPECNHSMGSIWFKEKVCTACKRTLAKKKTVN